MPLILLMISYRRTAIALISSTAPLFFQPPAFFIRWGSGAVAKNQVAVYPFQISVERRYSHPVFQWESRAVSKNRVAVHPFQIYMER